MGLASLPRVSSPVAQHSAGDLVRAVVELVAGSALMAVATIAGLVFVHRPWANRIDALGFRLLPRDLSARWAIDVIRLGSRPVLIVGCCILALIAWLSRDKVGAVTCVVAPVVAVVVVELVAKPLVDRHIQGTSALSYPSGTVTAIAALAAAAVIAVPAVAKGAVAVLGVVLILLSCMAVVVLRWHFPTDAMGGVAVGVGAVLAADGFLRLVRRSRIGIGPGT
jgi:membrane-associated phospholipid phosphatase